MSSTKPLLVYILCYAGRFGTPGSVLWRVHSANEVTPCTDWAYSGTQGIQRCNWRENSSRYRQWTPLTVAILPLYAQIPYLTKHTWRRHTRLRHTHNSVGSALHTHRRDPDTRIQVGHTTNTQFQYTLQCNTQIRHVRSVRALGPEGPSRVLKLPVSRDAPAHSLTTHGAGACQPTQDRALGSILYFIPHSSPFSFEAARLSRTCP